jgi:hypothetical protein
MAKQACFTRSPVSSSTGHVMSSKTKAPHTGAMKSRPARELSCESRISQKLEAEEVWVRTARGYLKDPNLLHGIQSLKP